MSTTAAYIVKNTLTSTLSRAAFWSLAPESLLTWSTLNLSTLQKVSNAFIRSAKEASSSLQKNLSHFGACPNLSCMAQLATPSISPIQLATAYPELPRLALIGATHSTLNAITSDSGSNGIRTAATLTVAGLVAYGIAQMTTVLGLDVTPHVIAEDIAHIVLFNFSLRLCTEGVKWGATLAYRAALVAQVDLSA